MKTPCDPENIRRLHDTSRIVQCPLGIISDVLQGDTAYLPISLDWEAQEDVQANGHHIADDRVCDDCPKYEPEEALRGRENLNVESKEGGLAEVEGCEKREDAGPE